jgi:anion-transporting  ArsA/GET3 family ATPase
MMPSRSYMRAAGVAVQTFFRSVGRVVGTEVIDDVVAFFRAFEGMEQGFRERAASVTALLGAADTSFVLVTSPRRDAVQEAEFFAARLRESSLSVGALVVNRVHPAFATTEEVGAMRVRADELRERAARGADPEVRAASDRLADRFENLADYSALGARERAQLADSGRGIGAATVVYVPSLAHDIVDFAALDAVAEHLG